MMKIKVLVLMGGPSFEHEVSLVSGRAIYESLLLSKNYEPIEVFIDKNGNPEDPEFYKKGDFAFIAMHGPYGEDGTIQGFLESVNLPYSGAGILASAIGMNKEIARKIVMAEGIPVVPTLFYGKNDFTDSWERVYREVEEKFGYPCAVKTPVSGSSIGINLVDNREELREGIIEALKFGERFMVEEYMTLGYKDGGELECGVLGNDEPRALSLCQFIPKKRYYDYEAKYTPGLTDFYIPALVSKEVLREAQEIALRVFRAVNGEGFARVDMYIKKGKLYFSEINTIPGFTPTSVFPMLAQHEGIGFTELIEEIVRLGFESYEKRKRVRNNFLLYPNF